MLFRENRWLAQRYRYADGLVDFGRGEHIAYSDLLEKIIEVVGEDARELRFLAEVKRAREIVSESNSAHASWRYIKKRSMGVPTNVKSWWLSSIG